MGYWVGAAAPVLLGAWILAAGYQSAPDTSAQHSALGTELAATRSVVQERKPNISLPDLDGRLRAFADAACPVAVVHFFATWCEPCREELASLSRLDSQGAVAGTCILAVSVAEPPLRVRKFLQSAPVTFPVLLDADRAASRAWGVTTLPTTLVVDGDLTVRLRVEGDVDWSRADLREKIELLGPDSAR